MTVEDLADTLHQECIAEASTAFVSTILDAARAALTAGNGSVGALTSGSGNGKSYSRAVSLNPAEVIRACRMALNRYLGDGTDEQEVSSTLPDFSALRL